MCMSSYIWVRRGVQANEGDAMSEHASATFKVESWNEETTVEARAGAGKLRSARVEQSLSGEIEGAGLAQWLMCYRADETADFVGLQRIDGTVGGRRGSFVADLERDLRRQGRRRRDAGRRGLRQRRARRDLRSRQLLRAARRRGRRRARLRAAADDGRGHARPDRQPARRAVAGGRRPHHRLGHGRGRAVDQRRRRALGAAALPRPPERRPAAPGARADLVGHGAPGRRARARGSGPPRAAATTRG